MTVQVCTARAAATPGTRDDTGAVRPRASTGARSDGGRRRRCQAAPPTIPTRRTRTRRTVCPVTTTTRGATGGRRSVADWRWTDRDDETRVRGEISSTIRRHQKHQTTRFSIRRRRAPPAPPAFCAWSTGPGGGVHRAQAEARRGDRREGGVLGHGGTQRADGVRRMRRG